MTRRGFGFVAPPPPESVSPGDRPSFSVAIAAYQAADTVGAAVESALSQTVSPAQVIVCDDGSTDDLAGALTAVRERIVLIRQENRGEAAAKNAAARRATADFVAFLDADDLYYPKRLEALGELAMARPDLDVLTTNADLEFEGRVVGRYYPDVARFPAENQAAAILASDSAIFGAAAVRRSTLEAAGGLYEGLRSSDDWELWLRLVLAGTRFGLVDEPLYRYRLHEQGTSADQVRGALDCVTALERVRELGQPTGDELASLERSLAYHRSAWLLAAAEEGVRDGKRAEAWRVASSGEFPWRTRLKTGLAAAFPRAAARALDRRERRTGHSRLRKPIPSR
jgi:glycosyltransferase involved in cell wall biosynthesis